MFLQISSILMLMISAALCAPGGVRQNMMRLAREDKNKPVDHPQQHTFDGMIGGPSFNSMADSYRREQLYRLLDLVRFLDSMDNSYQAGEALKMLEALSDADFLSSLDATERMAVLEALKKSAHTKHPKRMLDSVSGWAFGESKRNFDEIDNVGFTGFAKRSPRGRYSLALAKKNFDEIDRAGFETYNKRNFDEIDRTGFDTYQKRDRKD